jgi:hypothetical protein
MKNTTSGPSSVASLNSGWGWALSIIGPSYADVAILRDGASRLLRMRTFRIASASS